MIGASKPLRKPRPSGRGPHPRGEPSAKPRISVDDEFRSFFDRGDAGDYEGGVGRLPARIQPISYEGPQIGAAPPSQNRRAVLTKVVLSIMGACVGLLLIAVAVKAPTSSAPEADRFMKIEGSDDPLAATRATVTRADPAAVVPAAAAALVPPSVPRAAEGERSAAAQPRRCRAP